jgi:hypothetical protein
VAFGSGTDRTKAQDIMIMIIMIIIIIIIIIIGISFMQDIYTYIPEETMSLGNTVLQLF